MNLFRNIFKPTKSDTSKATTLTPPSQGEFLPCYNMPTDEKFLSNFKINGGKFLYCITLDEVFGALDNILIENDWYETDVSCNNELLKSKFSGYNLNFEGDIRSSSFFFSTCESLIANNGSILFSSNQLKEIRLSNYPKNIIVFATTSQLIEDIGDGLRNIKMKCNGNIPNNITAIKNFNVRDENNFMSYGSSSKNLYLLLLEDL